MSNSLGMTEKDLIESRINKLKKIKDLGVDPYPSVCNKDHSAKEIISDAEKLIASCEKVALAGRIRAIRGHGKLVFADVEDESGKIQVVLKFDQLQDFKLVELLDVGDFAEVAGTIFRTDAGELSLLANKLRVLTKAIRPLPSSWHGLRDQETRYRERYVDLIVNEEVKDKFYIRSKVIQTLRQELLDKGFLEVDTPTLQSIAGGASAKPFTTHYNAYDRDVFLRIAPELYLKRLLVGGFEKVFEFARCFRNEGVDASHNPEFTNLEFYWAYADYEKMMDFVEEMIRAIVRAINKGNLALKVGGQTIDFGERFDRKTFAEISGGKSSDEAFKKGVLELINPTFVINHPTELIPLAKKNGKNSALVDSFQLVIAGVELAKAFSELNDPIDQRERFMDQMKLREGGDEEAQMIDEDFLKALEYGMPPTAGCGIGIDRLVRVLTDAKTLREVLLFPFMKPDQAAHIGKSDETKSVAIVLNKSSKLDPWQEMNAVAHLAASFAGRTENNLYFQDSIKSKDGKEIKLNIQHAIMIREADSEIDLQCILTQAEEAGLEAYEFTREMQETTDDKKVSLATRAKLYKQIEHLGVLVYGKKSKIDKICKPHKLKK